MKSLYLLPILFSLFCAINSFGATICYFSLNNEKEYTEMEKFTAKLNEHSSEKIEVKEFLSSGANVEKSFEKMASSGTKCDGLVISGHHTGSFGGVRGYGSLDIDFIEKLSCDSKYKDFFNNVKGLWLQGCRTLGVEKIEAEESADNHADRVYNLRHEDDLEQSFLSMGVEFSATLDQDNPLSSRYLRVFPRATTFGWTKIAPGENAYSQLSIPFHIAHIARVNDDRGRFFEDPISEFGTESATKYTEALLSILNRADSSDSECRSVEAWINHGNHDKFRKFSFDNQDINAYRSLATGDYGPLWEAKAVECVLKNNNDPDTVLNSIDKILSDRFLIGYTYNSIYETLQRLRRNGEFETYSALKQKLETSPEFTRFMMKKLASSEVGIIRKIEYYSLLAEIMGTRNPKIETMVNDALVEILSKPIGRHDYVIRDDQITLLEAMFKHGVISEKSIAQIASMKDLNQNVKSSLITNLAKFDLENPVNIYARLISKENSSLMQAIGNSVGSSDLTESERSEIIKVMIANDKQLRGKGSLAAISALDKSSCGVENCSEIVMSLAKTSRERYLPMLSNLMNKVSIKNPAALVAEILGRSNLDTDVKTSVIANIGGIQNLSSSQKSSILAKYIDQGEYVGVALALTKFDRFEDRELKMFDEIIKRDKSCSSCSSLLEVLSRSNLDDKEYSKRFDHIVNLASRSSVEVTPIAEEILYSSRLDKQARTNAWNHLVKSETIGDVERFNVANTILSPEIITKEEIEVLHRFANKFDQPFFKEAFTDLIQSSGKLSENDKKYIISQ